MQSHLELMQLAPRRPRVLLAEDETEMRSLIARTLRKEQCDIVEARDGSQLIRLLMTHLLAPSEGHEPVDLIISDIRMPGANGLDVVSALRRQDTETPVILITAFGDADTHLEAYRLGAVMVLNKPFEMEDLRLVVRSLVE
jgi:DNA-binding response OmpR family regulator